MLLQIKLGRLEYLGLVSDNMSNVWCHQIPKCFFTTLTRLKIEKCPKISSLFSCSVVENLDNLGYLTITNCEGIEEVILKEDNENDGKKSSHIAFPKLVTLELEYLSSLTSLGKGIKSIEFPMLGYLYIRFCPKLRSLVSPIGYNQDSGNLRKHDHELLPSLCDEKVRTYVYIFYYVIMVEN